MKVIKTNIKAETVEINPREAEALRNTFQVCIYKKVISSQS